VFERVATIGGDHGENVADPVDPALN
jgi:hypothetical protein